MILGLVFNYNGNFNLSQKHLYNQGQKAMYALLQYARKYNLSVELQLCLFDKLVLPILTYNCEVWGYENTSLTENLHLKFLKYILKLKNSTPTIMIYGELGRYPLYIEIMGRILGYWLRLINSKPSKLNLKLYKICKNTVDLNLPRNSLFKWIHKIKSILQDLNESWLWNASINLNSNEIYRMKKHFTFILEKKYEVLWKEEVFRTPKCYLYRVYKSDFVKEKYFSKLSDAMSIALCRFRACNHKLPIESGRYLNIPRSERSCHLCNVNELCDEYLVIFKCEALNSLRQKYLPYYQRRIRQNTSVMALYNIFNTSERHLKKLTLFIINLTKLFT